MLSAGQSQSGHLLGVLQTQLLQCILCSYSPEHLLDKGQLFHLLISVCAQTCLVWKIITFKTWVEHLRLVQPKVDAQCITASPAAGHVLMPQFNV